MRELAAVWIAIGLQSVGGGTSTLLLMRRLLVERKRWITARDFTEAWALCQLSPGIHLVALAGLIGQRIAGWRGALVSVGGMMVPAATITALMTAAYGLVAEDPLAHAALAGMAPATGGMTAGLAIVMAQSARRRGALALIDLAVVGAAFALLYFTTAPSVAVVIGGAGLGALGLGHERPTSARRVVE